MAVERFDVSLRQVFILEPSPDRAYESFHRALARREGGIKRVGRDRKKTAPAGIDGDQAIDLSRKMTGNFVAEPLRNAYSFCRGEAAFAWKEFRAGVYRAPGTAAFVGVAGAVAVEWPKIVSFVAENADALKAYVEAAWQQSHTCQSNRLNCSKLADVARLRLSALQPINVAIALPVSSIASSVTPGRRARAYRGLAVRRNQAAGGRDQPR
jgi:hypothetical protein